MSNEILKHYPYFERNIAEFQKISEAESAELLSAKTQKDKILANQFVMTADNDGILMFEKLYGIIANPGESLQFRRERILNRIRLLPPFTETFLRALLDKFIGEGSYTLAVDYANYIIYINYGFLDENIKKGYIKP